MADRPSADVLTRSAAILFERLRELERYDPDGAAQLRAVIAAEVQRWYARDAVPLEVPRG